MSELAEKLRGWAEQMESNECDLVAQMVVSRDLREAADKLESYEMVVAEIYSHDCKLRFDMREADYSPVMADEHQTLSHVLDMFRHAGWGES